MGYYGFSEYVSVQEKKAKANRMIAALKKKNPDIDPIIIEGRTLAKSWWGKAWNKNLENYADYSNRVGRGKSYVRNNCVVDLQISQGNVAALVQGNAKKPYAITVKIDTLNKDMLAEVINLCNNKIGSVEELLEGKFPKDLEALFLKEKYELFPTPDEIHFNCNCPDYAYMCKHVAAVLYGIGAKFDSNPMLFFTLRDIDTSTLVKKSIEHKLENMLKNAGKQSEREIEEQNIFDIFGV